MFIRKWADVPSINLIPHYFEVVRQGREEILDAIVKVGGTMKGVIEPYLMREIDNPNSFVRWTVARIMREIPQVQFEPVLIPALGRGYLPAQNAILLALNSINPTRFPKAHLQDVIGRLTTEEKHAVLRSTVHTLGVDALDTTETLAGIQLMEMLQSPRALIPLIKTTHHRDPRVQQAARLTLTRFTEREINEECNYILQNASTVGSQLEFHLEGPEDYALYLYAIEGLGLIKDPHILKKLFHYLHHGNQYEKGFAIRGLELVFNRAGKSAKITHEIQEEIESLLRINLDENLQPNLIRTLGRINEPWATSALIFYLRDLNPTIRVVALEALANSPTNPEIETQIAPLLIDDHPAVRKSIVDLYWKINPGQYHGLHEGDILLKLNPALREEILEQ